MRHDYDLPADWQAMTDEQKCQWMTQERARRQSMNQKTATSKKIKKAEDRTERRVNARNEYVSVEDNR